MLIYCVLLDVVSRSTSSILFFFLFIINHSWCWWPVDPNDDKLTIPSFTHRECAMAADMITLFGYYTLDINCYNFNYYCTIHFISQLFMPKINRTHNVAVRACVCCHFQKLLRRNSLHKYFSWIVYTFVIHFHRNCPICQVKAS